MLNIVIPMAGRGKRFSEVGYDRPKPLIDIYGHPMIEYVVRNIRPKCEHQLFFICLQEHLEEFNLASELERMAPGCTIITIDHVTEGAACTVLLAEKYIDSSDALMIANSDQFVNTDFNDYLAAMGEADGLIMTLPAYDPRWSFVRCDENGFVTQVREKEVISNEGTVGIYNFRHGSDFVKYAHQMIAKNIRTNGEFYVAPVYNEMIEAEKKLVTYNVGENVYNLGTPESLEQFMQIPFSKTIF